MLMVQSYDRTHVNTRESSIRELFTFWIMTRRHKFGCDDIRTFSFPFGLPELLRLTRNRKAIEDKHI